MMEKVASEANVPESEIKDYYEKNKDKDQQMQEPNRFSFTHIKVKTAAEANSIIARIKAGEDPAEIAKKLSTAPDAKEGGAVRKAPQMQLKYQYGDEFVKALSDANEGQVIGPISVRGEYEVARHEGKLSARVLPFEKVKDQIKQNLQEKAKQEKTQQFLKELRTEAQPQVQESDFVKKMQSKNEPK
jgi:foldase protein PrsA